MTPTFHPTPEGLTTHPAEWLGKTIVYIIHFETAYVARGSGRRVRHYIGMTRNFERRMSEHRNPDPRHKGARLLAAVNADGIPWKVVGWWEDGSRAVEKAMKAGRNHARHCPVCTPAPARPRKPRMTRPDWKRKSKPFSISTSDDNSSTTIHTDAVGLERKEGTP